MGVDVLLGLQWGDEGKGKIVDYLSPKYDLVCRFQGGPNAGHTLEFDNIKHVLHQIPSGIFRENIQNVIGNGVVLDPVVFRKEVDALTKLGVDCKKNLFISKRSTLILPTHRLLDAASEASMGTDKIGSTLRGIGPTYQDKIGRIGLRVGDIGLSDFKEKYTKLVNRHKEMLRHLNYEYKLEELESEFFEAIELLKNFNLIDNELLVNNALEQNKTVLAEGAQGSLLDIDFGSYPFVTSSNTMCAGACTGLGVAPSRIGEVYGIFKAYCTRVGSGPFPTELFDAVGENLRKVGSEFGATTGRPRRCGWLDLPALKYVITINGVTQLFMMKSDVLNEFDEIKICTHYRMKDGTLLDRLTYESLNEPIEPVYRSFKGWNCTLEGINDFSGLPKELLDYVKYIEEELKVPINIVSVGPKRSQTIIREANTA